MDTTNTQIGSPAFIRQHYLSRSIKLYLIGIVIVGLGVAYYGIESFLDYSEKRGVVEQSQSLLANLTKEQKKEMDGLNAIKVEYKDRDAAMEGELNSVFPIQENYTEVTKILDDYFFSKNKPSNPLIATDVQFGSPVSEAGSKYDILPISMNITASEANFYDFLRFVQGSGTLSKKLRLLDLKSIQLNFSEDESASAKKSIQFRAEVSAYFQKTKK